jgi:hypothetical protein
MDYTCFNPLALILDIPVVLQEKADKQQRLNSKKLILSNLLAEKLYFILPRCN